ncbi:MAG TPA: hypothetical protein VHF22_07495, partial [Planctomycetota bacterium]|nr:hypothetical protein [Planctomycetota bacterium]
DREKPVDWLRNGIDRTDLMPDIYDEYAGDAVSECGELGLADTLDRLKELSAFGEKIGHTKFQALVSRWELGDRRALYDLEKFLPYYDDSIMREVWVQAGQVEFRTARKRWSSIFEVCEKAERVNDPKYLDLLELLLRTKSRSEDPMASGWVKKVTGGAVDGGTSGREERSKLERPPEVSYLCRDQFVRRRIAQAAARIAGEKAAPQLARALRDSRSVVRAAALEEIGKISGLYKLDVGSPEKDEHAVFMQAVGWLKSKGAWPE